MLIYNLWLSQPFVFWQPFDCHGFVWRYAQYGDVSPKVDVYAFGVVLYELISAKEAIVKTNDSATDSKGLVALVSVDFSKYFLLL